MLLEAFIVAISSAVVLQMTTGTTRYYVGLFVFFFAMLLCSIWGLMAAIPMMLLGRRYDVNWLVARTFYELASRWMGITITVEGAEYLETQPAMFIGNHQSMMDILYLAKMFPKRTSVMAKESLKYTPLLGQWMLLSGAVFIDRGNNKQAMESLERAGDDMKKRSISLWIFPEGTRTLFETSNLLPFKKGAFHLAVQAGVPIVPVVCENYWRLYHKGVFASGELKLRVLPPIETTGLTSADVTKLAVDTRELMLKTLKDISVPVSKEVELKDNAALAKISKEVPSANVLTNPAPDVATEPAPSPPAASASSLRAPAGPGQVTEPDTKQTISTSNVGGGGVPTSEEMTAARDRKISLSSAEDDELVIVPRPDQSQTM